MSHPVNYLLALSDGCGRMEGMNTWISVEERLPESKAGDVLVWDGTMMGMASYDRTIRHWCCPQCIGGYDCNVEMWDKITYWMPLPEPPTIVQQA